MNELAILEWHLSGNLFPPMTHWLTTAQLALAKVREGDRYAGIELPKGVTFDGASTAPAQAIVDHLRLNELVEGEEGDSHVLEAQ